MLYEKEKKTLIKINEQSQQQQKTKHKQSVQSITIKEILTILFDH